ncbi:hypothetical protein [Lawsonibacter sp. JLR.KK007]|uniref:hypothetical protein n=1 Tax=Lawsonibacter sp. JLR.KK007 TaxID=3114293 RepID=UPI002FF07E8C
MRRCIEHRELIPAAQVPAALPEGIAARYYVRWPGDFHEITPSNVKRVLKNLRSGVWMDIYLYREADEEGDYLELETDGTLYNLSYGEDLGQVWWSTYDPKYLDSDEETNISHSDGQTIIFRETTTTDKEAVMTALAYFIHAGKLWDGIPWMKRWQEWVEE